MYGNKVQLIELKILPALAFWNSIIESTDVLKSESKDHLLKHVFATLRPS